MSRSFRPFRAFVCLAWIVGASACQHDGGPASASAVAPRVAQVTASTALTAPTTTTASARAQARPAPPRTAPTRPVSPTVAPEASEEPPVAQGSLPLTVSVSPKCARPGHTVTARILSPQAVQFSVMVTYADGDTYDTRSFGQTQPDRPTQWSWTVDPRAPSGGGQLLVAASSTTTTDSASRAIPFTVARQACP